MSSLKPYARSTLFKLSSELPGAKGSLVFEFVQTLVGLDALAHRIAPSDIARVEAAWGHTEGDFYWVGGFVVNLHDGRRVYLHAFCDADTCHHAAYVSVAQLAASAPYDSVAPRTLPGGKPVRWEAAPERLNEVLRRLALEV